MERLRAPNVLVPRNVLAHDAGMDTCCGEPHEEDICICFHVRRDKVIRYVRRERPPVVSLISECLSAGTGCGWCIPFLEQIHEDVMAGREPGPPMSGAEYKQRRSEYRQRLAAGNPEPRA